MPSAKQAMVVVSSCLIVAAAVYFLRPLVKSHRNVAPIEFGQRPVPHRPPKSNEILVPPAAVKRPHILVLLADDMGWANIRYHRTKADDPNNEVVTPNLDKLAENGIELDRHYAFRYCSPSRSSLLTGRLPVHVNVENLRPDYSNADDPESGSPGIPRSMTTIAAKLRAAGYATHQVGKWDVGMATPDHTPQGRGFETSLGYFHHHISYYDHEADGYTDMWNTDRPARRLAGSKYAEELFANRCSRIIQQHDPTAPLFLYYAIHLAHGPLEVPDEYLDRFAFVNNTLRRQYAAAVNYVDDVVGDLVQQLKDRGMWDDTLVLFSSDNGGPVFEGGGGNNFPLRGGKTSNFEGGVRVNAFVSGGFVPPHRRGAKESGFIHISDWFSTFCSLAGVDPTDHTEADLPPIDSMNMWPLLSGQVTESPRTEVQLDTTALISGDFKLLTGEVWEDYWVGPIYPNETNPEGGSPNVLQCGDEGCLFNIRADPNEHADVAQAMPEKRRELLQRLAALNTTFFNPNRGPKDPRAKAQARENGGYWGPWLP